MRALPARAAVVTQQFLAAVALGRLQRPAFILSSLDVGPLTSVFALVPLQLAPPTDDALSSGGFCTHWFDLVELLAAAAAAAS